MVWKQVDLNLHINWCPVTKEKVKCHLQTNSLYVCPVLPRCKGTNYKNSMLNSVTVGTSWLITVSTSASTRLWLISYGLSGTKIDSITEVSITSL